MTNIFRSSVSRGIQLIFLTQFKMEHFGATREWGGGQKALSST